MACTISSNYTLGCNDGVGGIDKVFIANYSASTTYTLSADNTITGVTSGGTFYSHEMPKEAASFNENSTTSGEFGTNSTEQILTLRFNKYSAALRDRVLLLMQARTRVIVKFVSGSYFLMGKSFGCDGQTGTGTSGKAFTEGNGWTITLRATEIAPADAISSGAVAAISV